MGHMLLQTYLVTVAIHWIPATPNGDTVETRYERLERLRELTHRHGLLLQEEARSVAVAVFGQMSLIAHLGLDQPDLADENWYMDCAHPYVEAIAALLDELTTWQDIDQLEFLVSAGKDPFTQLKVRLDRQVFPLSAAQEGQITPKKICQDLETQRIYVFSRHEDTLSSE